MFRFAVSLLVAASGMDDETSLMQGMKPNQPEKVDKSKAISSLLASATSMLKNGETTDVVNFAQATLSEIMNDVLPTIVTAHETDQILVNETWALFGEALHNLAVENNKVKELHDVEREWSRRHKACRDEEKVICDHKRECDYELYDIWLRFVEEEYELRDLSKQVEDHFCVEGANGTMWGFRDTSVTLFPPWRIQKPIVEQWEQTYHEKVPVCENWYRGLDTKTEECNGYQRQLEDAACEHANEATLVRIRFARYWRTAVQVYQQLVDEVHCLELDRWKEWRTLTTVQCLLNRTTLRNGHPCDETTGEADREIMQCEQEQYDESIEHIRIHYPQIPPFPAPCARPPWEGDRAPPPLDGIEFWPGQCVPQVPHAPCSMGFWAQEYADLPAVPEPQFHHENSHCNPRPPCMDCFVCREPAWCHCLFDWAWAGTTRSVAYDIGGFYIQEYHDPSRHFEFYGDWIEYPEAEHECHEATQPQIGAGIYQYARVNTGPAPTLETVTVTAAPLAVQPLNLDLLQYRYASTTDEEEDEEVQCAEDLTDNSGTETDTETD